MKKDKFLALLSKKLTGEISEEEGEMLSAELQTNEEYKQIADKLGRYFNHAKGKNAKTDQLRTTWTKIVKAENDSYRETFNFSEPKIIRFGNSTGMKIAAILLVVISIGFSIQYLLKKQTSAPVESIATTQQKTFLILDDGTKIWLNKNSLVSYNKDFGKQKREISLTGEAYFDVTKNKIIPLIIHVGTIDIEVKGTAFNVSAYKESREIQVALIRGLIQVTNTLNTKQQILLSPNQKIIFSKDNRKDNFLVMPISTQQEAMLTKWTSDTLTFKKEKLKDLALQLEKKYELKIEIQSEQLKERRFSGTFTTETLQQVLDALKLSYPLTYTINNKLVIIKD